MNLISDAWIPIRRQSGEEVRIAPWDVTARYSDDPVVALAAPRPDFNGALIQFLIGLLQTTCVPDSPLTRRTWLREPPAPDVLHTKFEEIAYAFTLDSDGPRFMQDMQLSQGGGIEATPIGALLIDQPGENTMQHNIDHFIKRGGVEQLCSACAALAVFTLQTNAPLGGRGHLTGLRGGGPLTTLILGATLWQTAWLNVLERTAFLAQSGDPNKTALHHHFPWLAALRTSESGSPTAQTTPLDVHPNQHFWATPRRIWLVPESVSPAQPCDICEQAETTVYRQCLMKTYGVNYQGPWLHPLSPYYLDKESQPLPVHPQPGGIGYRHWLGLVENSADKTRRIARVLEQYRGGRQDGRLWAFGYDMKNMKARCWYDAEMPLICASEGTEAAYVGHIAAMIDAADTVVDEVRRQVKNALFRRPADIRGDLSYLDSRFWSATEPEFYALLPRARDALNAGEDVTPLLREWHTTLTNTARRIFNDVSQTGDFNAADPRRIARAWNALNRVLTGRRLRERLGLAA